MARGIIGMPPTRLPSSWKKRGAAFAAVCVVGVAGIWIVLASHGSGGPRTPAAVASKGSDPGVAPMHWRSSSGLPVALPSPVVASGDVRGRVVDAATGEPIANADVTLRDDGGEILDETTSESDGNFRLAPTSAPVIAAQALGYAFFAQPVIHGGAPLVLALDGAVSIKGRVVDGHGDAIADADVWIEDREGEGERSPTPVSSTTRTRADGSFEVRDAPSGRLVAWARHPAHAQGQTRVGVLGPGKRKDGVEITLAEGGAISGRVVTADGRGVAGALVGFVPAPDADVPEESVADRVESGSDGRFHLDHFPSAKGWIAAVSGEGDASAGVEVAESGASDVELRITPGGVIEGRVVDAHGAGAGAATLQVRTEAGGSAEDFAVRRLRGEARRRADGLVTRADGRFTIRGLHGAGPFEISATAADGSAGSVRSEAGAHDVVISLLDRTVHGRVVTAEGVAAPVQGRVRLRESATDEALDLRDTRVVEIEGGIFDLTNVRPGTYQTTAEIRGYPEPAAVKVEVPAAGPPPTVTIRLAKRATVRGRLVGPTGAPVRGARVSASTSGRRDLPGSTSGALDWASAVRSDADGRFSLGAGAGAESLFVYHPDFQPALVPLSISSIADTDAGTITLHTGDGSSAVFEFSGIGAVLSRREAGIIVTGVLPGSPAERSGVRKDDRILSVDGVTTEGMEMEDLISRVRGPVGTTVTLQIARAGNVEPLRFDIIREQLRA